MRSIKFDQLGHRTMGSAVGVARPAQLAAGSLSFRAEDATRAAREPVAATTEAAGVAAVAPPSPPVGQGRE